jgi:hypothetical protein
MNNLWKTKDKKMKIAKLTTKSGYTWQTRVNGSVETIKDYFLGKPFNIESYPSEKKSKVIKVEIEDHEIAKRFTFKLTNQINPKAFLKL